jgi:branched-chain amino acid aminotransferase
MWIFLNDRFVPKEDAVVSVFDHGFLYGDGIYETLRAYGGRMFMLERHLARLRRSGRLIGLNIPVPEKDWPGLLTEALDRNGLGPAHRGLGRDSTGDVGASQDAHVRITISRGEGEIGLDPALCPCPTVVITVKPLSPYPPHLFTGGVKLAVVTVRRNLVAALSPQVKSLNFLNNILAKQEATRAGAFDALMLNSEGRLTECTTSNLFFVRDGVLCTPSVECGILDGITREVVLLLARENGIQIEEGRYNPEVLLQADECFLTNTTMELMPVSEIDAIRVGSGRPGPLTTKLRDLFRSNLARFLAPAEG